MWTRRTRQSTKGNRVAMNEREKCRECDDRRATTLSKKPRARRNERRRGGKVGCDNHEWRLCDEAHANNDRWRSSDDDSRDVGQTWSRANKQLMSNFTSADDATGVTHIVATTTTMAVIMTIAIANASCPQMQRTQRTRWTWRLRQSAKQRTRRKWRKMQQMPRWQ